MALDTYLVVFHRFDTHSLHKLEKYYLSIITIVTFIPALVFLFIRTPAKGPVYGSEKVSSAFSHFKAHAISTRHRQANFEQIWCSISPKWVVLRIVLYYAPVWYVQSRSGSKSYPMTRLID